ARIENGQPQLLQRSGSGGEDMVLVLGVDEDRGAAQARLLADQYQRQLPLGCSENSPGMPGDLIGPVAQEVIVSQILPQRDDTAFVEMNRPAKQRQGLTRRLRDPFLALERILHTPAQRP